MSSQLGSMLFGGGAQSALGDSPELDDIRPEDAADYVPEGAVAGPRMLVCELCQCIFEVESWDFIIMVLGPAGGVLVLAFDGSACAQCGDFRCRIAPDLSWPEFV